jgi:hypothetical protein
MGSNYGGPTTCTGPGDYQHKKYACENGVPKLRVSSWANSDGSITIVPAEFRAEGASPGFVPGMTMVIDGTFHTFDPEQGFVDTGKAATPLVEYDSSGKRTRDGYNPGTGKWEGDSLPPANASKVPAAFDAASAALGALGALLGK